MYSAMKIKANGPLLYSVLNPETNSDSPSAKSKGVRAVSAREVMNQITPIRGVKRRRGVEVTKRIFIKFKEERRIRAVIRMRTILTS